MIYNQERTFAVARLREAARECGVRKNLLKLRSTASRRKVAEVAEAARARPDRFAAAKERARQAYEDFLAAAAAAAAAPGNEAGAGGEAPLQAGGPAAAPGNDASLQAAGEKTSGGWVRSAGGRGGGPFGVFLF